MGMVILASLSQSRSLFSCALCHTIHFVVPSFLRCLECVGCCWAVERLCTVKRGVWWLGKSVRGRAFGVLGACLVKTPPSPYRPYEKNFVLHYATAIFAIETWVSSSTWETTSCASDSGETGMRANCLVSCKVREKGISHRLKAHPNLHPNFPSGTPWKNINTPFICVLHDEAQHDIFCFSMSASHNLSRRSLICNVMNKDTSISEVLSTSVPADVKEIVVMMKGNTDLYTTQYFQGAGTQETVNSSVLSRKAV
ncbi:hypothetical protein EI94DRAFT_1704831 [Lactarius quietus]|nr:hypothetical protein EI94DRAFT_1704831 [Lactarius quietus]